MKMFRNLVLLVCMMFCTTAVQLELLHVANRVRDQHRCSGSGESDWGARNGLSLEITPPRDVPEDEKL
jgi:hypothetical protein